MPCLKEVDLTLNSWRKGWDTDGLETLESRQMRREGNLDLDGDLPNWLQMVPRFCDDVQALMELTALKKLPKIPIRMGNPNAV